jgi:hypothetical protein
MSGRLTIAVESDDAVLALDFARKVAAMAAAEPGVRVSVGTAPSVIDAEFEDDFHSDAARPSKLLLLVILPLLLLLGAVSGAYFSGLFDTLFAAAGR